MLLGLSLILLSYHVLVTRCRRQLRSNAFKPVYKDKELVFAATSVSDMSWVAEELPAWSANIYRTDEADAALAVPVNKGNEAMVYLTFVLSLLLVLAAECVQLYYQSIRGPPRCQHLPP